MITNLIIPDKIATSEILQAFVTAFRNNTRVLDPELFIKLFLMIKSYH